MGPRYKAGEPMSDSIAADIQVGGKILFTDIDKLAHVINQGGLNRQDGDNFHTVEDIRGYILNQITEKQPLYLCDWEAANGCFPNLEAWVRQHGMCYRRHSDAKYEYNAEIEAFIPDKFGDEIISIPSNQDGDILLNPRHLRCCLAEGKTLQQVVHEYEAIEADVPPIELKEK